jgi:hypothetical protein
MYGATGDAAGYSLNTLLGTANVLSGTPIPNPWGLNSGINSFDITNGFNAIANGGTLGTTNWDPPN